MLGLMSGTSIDGVDAALVEIEGPSTVRLVAWETRPYEPTERAAILQVITNGSVRDVALLHRQLGNWLAEAGSALLKRTRHSATSLACVASHGQTVWHEPGQATLQLGCPATLAERLGVQVVSDFRSRDVAGGGQGAPLVPVADAMLFGHPTRGRALLNIGGIANVTWVPKRGALDGVMAFDTGPGVAVIDAVARLADSTQPYDRDGARAARGSAVAAVVDELIAHPYFAASPPKSTGREAFGGDVALRLVALVRSHRSEASDDDCVATAVELTARSIASAFARWLPGDPTRDLVVSGGGARNPTLLARVRTLLPDWPVRLFDEEFFDGDAKEAVAFAYLGWRTLHGLAGNVPTATGAVGPRVLGSITPG